jgi:hypothetical protein
MKLNSRSQKVKPGLGFTKMIESVGSVYYPLLFFLMTHFRINPYF